MTTNGRFQSLFDTTPDVVLIMDDAGIVVSANAAVKPVLGYAPDQLIGQTLSRIMPERFRSAHDAGFRRYLETGTRKLDWRSIKLPGLDASGCEVPLSIAFGEFQEGGRRYFTGILRDVSEEKATADILEFLSRIGPQLASSSLDYEATLKNLAQLAVPLLADWSAVDIVGSDGRPVRLAVAHTDPSMVAMAHELATRYPSDPDAPTGVPQVIRSGLPEFMTEIPPEMIRLAAKDAHHLELITSLGLRSYLVVPISAHGRTYGALTLVHAESGRRFTQSDVPLMEELGRRAGLAVHNAGLYRDALNANRTLEEQAIELEHQTEEAQALAEELEAQTQELIATTAALKLQTDEADAANQAKSAFLASMSHELRTPLNAIAGYVELLEMGLRGPVTPAQQSDLERIRMSQRHLLALINDVLNFAKVEAGRLEYQLEVIALDKILKDCEAMILPQIHSKRISYAYEECGESVFVKADAEKVRQIVLNLLSNAVKFTKEGGSISASCDQTDEVGRIHVEDTGIGIESDKLESVFEPFVQINRSLNQPGDGAGLGLSISRSLALAMKGEIIAVSSPGAGSKFSLILPLSDAT